VGHKGSWVNLDLGCGLAALSPLLPHQEVTALLRRQSRGPHQSRRQPTALPGLRCGARLAHRASPSWRPTPVVRSEGGACLFLGLASCCQTARCAKGLRTRSAPARVCACGVTGAPIYSTPACSPPPPDGGGIIECAFYTTARFPLGYVRQVAIMAT
jgi:hypothetical protein